MDSLLLWIGTYFTEETYMFYTKIQGMIWSMADFLLIFFILKIIDLVRANEGKGKIFFRYLFLWSSAVLTPLLILPQTKDGFFLLESIICGIQFSILVYTVMVERKRVFNFIHGMMIRHRRSIPGSNPSETLEKLM
ncbi:MAG: hypothetical protein ABIG67_01675 [Pseudomonadota bacterium]